MVPKKIDAERQQDLVEVRPKGKLRLNLEEKQ